MTQTRAAREMLPEELEEALLSMGEKSYRASQLFQWFHEKRVSDYGKMRNLPASLRTRLAESSPLFVPEILRVQRSETDGTAKFLSALSDGNCIESVCMPYKFGNTVCVSSQAGCAMDCAFCASAEGGFQRNLTVSEMLSQVYTIAEEEAGTVTHVVVMGSGEPFHNYDNLIRFLTLLSHEKGMHLSRRHLTVSTCGITERIADFARDFPQANLAVSLHAPTQEQRERIMPVARAYPLPLLMDACRAYADRTGRLVTFEYALMHGFNDSEQDAAHLAKLLPDIPCAVNLIPVNPVRGKTQKAPSRTDVLKFKKNLEKSDIHVTIRREMGRDIDGACGQLVRRAREETVC